MGTGHFLSVCVVHVSFSIFRLAIVVQSFGGTWVLSLSRVLASLIITWSTDKVNPPVGSWLFIFWYRFQGAKRWCFCNGLWDYACLYILVIINQMELKQTKIPTKWYIKKNSGRCYHRNVCFTNLNKYVLFLWGEQLVKTLFLSEYERHFTYAIVPSRPTYIYQVQNQE